LRPIIVFLLVLNATLHPLGAASDPAASAIPLSVVSTPSIPNANHPSLVYWFWTSDTVADETYLKDVANFADASPFNFMMLTQRTGVSFYDFEPMHPRFAATVKAAHQRGLQVGLQLWPRADTTDLDQAAAVAVDNEFALDASGSATCVASERHARHPKPLRSEVLRLMLFKKAAEGFYEPGTLIDYTARAQLTAESPNSLTVQVNAGPEHAGWSAFLITAHYQKHADLFSGHYERTYAEAFQRYGDIPFDGTALDEFVGLKIDHHLHVKPDTLPWRERIYGRSFARIFQQQTSLSLEDTLFAARYAPAGQPEVRIRAINLYMDQFSHGALRVENWFHAQSKQVFGPNTFAGIHSTFHNSLTNDEFWSTSLNWWATPRDYGQSDEFTLYPTRIGIAFSKTRPVLYNQFYTKNLARLLEEPITAGRVNTRVHYHAYNDTRWGVDLKDPAVLAQVGQVEQKIHLLNQFDGPSVRAPLLVVFGFPALLNWYPDYAARNSYDLNGALNIEEKADALWQAGYPCALVPSYEIDSGKLHLNERNQIVYNGHTFESLLFLHPQYAKDSTLTFLESYASAGGRFALDGAATHDFHGRDIRARFATFLARAAARGSDVAAIRQLGLQPNPYPNGSTLEDGSVILTDLASIQHQTPIPFRIELHGHVFTGTFSGVVALKAAPSGQIEKFACGQASGLWRDGQPVLQLPRPADCVLTHTPEHGPHLRWTGDEAERPHIIFTP
jgi:hypothetical protein